MTSDDSKISAMRCLTIVGDANRQRAIFLGLAQTGDRKGSGAARGDRDHHICVADLMGLYQFSRMRRLILGAFDGSQECVFPAGNEKEKAVLRPAEGRDQFRPVLDGQAARGPGAGIDQPSAPAQAPHDCKRRPLYGKARASHGGDRCKLPFDHRFEDLCRLPEIDFRISGTWPFCFHGLILRRTLSKRIQSRFGSPI
jgi:hypothetical protein